MAEVNDDNQINNENTQHAFHVAVKPPKFDEASASRWFNIIESQFVIAKITSNLTKFHHVLANLPVNVMAQLSNEQIASNNYDTLKADIIALFSKSSPELFDSIVSQNHIICTKPTAYLNELRKIAAQANLGLSDEFIKIKFIKGVPANIRPMLATHPTDSLDELARVADTMLAYNPPSAVSYIKHNNAGHSDNYQRYSHNNDRNTDPFSRTQQYSGQRTKSDARPNYADASLPAGLRAFHSKQRPLVCRAHIYYGNDARTCKRWCILSNSNVKILPDSRPSSRSNSPVSTTRFSSEN